MLRFKGIVHPKKKMTPWFTHSQAILGVGERGAQSNMGLVVTHVV